MAEECHKPVFHLTATDGAIGDYAEAVLTLRQDYRHMAAKTAERMDRLSSEASSTPQRPPAA